MRLQISFELLVSLSLAFALMFYLAGALLGLAPRLSNLQQSASSQVANSVNLTQSMALQAGCFESSQVPG